MRNLTIGALLVLAAALPAQSNPPSPMLVQQATTVDTGTRLFAARLPQQPTLGNLLVVCIGTTAAVPIVSGGGVTNWTQCRTATTPGANLEIWAGFVDFAARPMVTVRTAGGPVAAVVSEWQGFGTTMMFAGGSASGVGSTVDVPVGSTLPATAGDLVIAAACSPRKSVNLGAPSPEYAPFGDGVGSKQTRLAAAWRVADEDFDAATQWSTDQPSPWAAAMVVFHMPLAAPAGLVQQAANSAQNVADLTVTLPQPPAPGSLLVVCHDSTSAGNSVVQGGGVAVWTLCRSTIPTADNSEIWAGVVTGVPDQTIVIALGGSPNSCSANVSEWQGFQLPPTIDGATASGQGGDATSPAAVGPVAADAGDLVIATVGIHSGDGELLGTATDGFLDLERPPIQSSSAMAAAYMVPTQASSYGTSWTFLYPHAWAATIAVFHHQ